METLALSPDEDALGEQAAELSEVLESGASRVKLVGPSGELVELPLAVYEALRRVAGELRRGNGVIVVPVDRLLTSSQAARLLNVSRPYLTRLLTERKIPFERVGSHRRVRLADLLAYREKRNEEREAALAEMVRRSEDAGFPY